MFVRFFSIGISWFVRDVRIDICQKEISLTYFLLHLKRIEMDKYHRTFLYSVVSEVLLILAAVIVV